MSMDYVAVCLLIALSVGALGFQTCSDVRAMSDAREEAPLVGVVEDVNIVPDGGLLAGGQDVYLQIDDDVYRLISTDDPVPAEGAVVEYHVIDDRVFDVVNIDGESRQAKTS